MNYFLLDVVAGSDIVRENTGIILFMVMCVFSEALVIWRLKTAYSFWKSVQYSTVANAATLLLGFLLVPLVESNIVDSPQIYSLLIYFTLSVIIEGLLLKLLIKDHSWKKIFVTSLIMNTVSYGILLLMLKFGHFR